MPENNITTILRTAEGKTIIYYCPRCRHFVESQDVVWKQEFVDAGEVGKVEGCVYCSKE